MWFIGYRATHVIDNYVCYLLCKNNSEVIIFKLKHTWHTLYQTKYNNHLSRTFFPYNYFIVSLFINFLNYMVLNRINSLIPSNSIPHNENVMLENAAIKLTFNQSFMNGKFNLVYFFFLFYAWLDLIYRIRERILWDFKIIS